MYGSAQRQTYSHTKLAERHENSNKAREPDRNAELLRVGDLTEAGKSKGCQQAQPGQDKECCFGCLAHSVFGAGVG